MIRKQYIVLLSAILWLLTSQISVGQDAENIVALWLLDDGNGNIATDSSGNGHDGTIEGAKWDEGKFEGGLTFMNSKVTVAPANDLILPEFTIEAWVKLVPTGAYQVIMTRGLDVRNYYLGIESFSGDVPMSNLTLDGGATWTSVHGGTTVTDDEWHHVAVTYDGDLGTIYVDGEVDGESPMLGPPDEKAEPQEIAIGWNGVGAAFVSGTLDEIGLWRVALEEEEIQKTMAEGLQTFIAPVNPQGKLPMLWGAIKRTNGAR